MKVSSYLRWTSGFVITLIVLYSISLLITIIIMLLLFDYMGSLFTNELSTQYGASIALGGMIYLIGGFFLLITSAALQGVYSKLKRTVERLDKSRKQPGYDKRLLLIAMIAVICSWALSAAIFIDGSDELIAVGIMGAVLLLLSFLNWKVVDIPARALAVAGDTTALKISTHAAVPMVVLGVSFIPFISALQYENAPTETIVSVYLEAMFALGVICTFVSLINIQSKLGKRIEALEKETEQ
ncbi:MAG: hypothetical protein ACMUHU_07500 [Thermoplasmatota archaeon]